MRAAEIQQVRRGAGLFELADRGLVRVKGGDRTRWLNGMVSNDVAALEPGSARSGCYAALLTPKGMIVSDLHVLLRPESLWLELPGEATPDAIARLERYIVADDVTLEDASDAFERLALEGPAAASILEAASGKPISLAPGSCSDWLIAGTEMLVAAFGWSGEEAYQLFVPAGCGVPVSEALRAAGASRGLVEAGRESLEILRIEAGKPLLGTELSDDTLPDEARLESAVSDTKGCYIGQEIVARLRSRGRVRHLLVGLRFASDAPPPPGTPLQAEARTTGEVTSACVSPSVGVIGLGYVRREHAEPGTALLAGEIAARVVALPLAGPGAA